MSGNVRPTVYHPRLPCTHKALCSSELIVGNYAPSNMEHFELTNIEDKHYMKNERKGGVELGRG